MNHVEQENSHLQQILEILEPRALDIEHEDDLEHHDERNIPSDIDIEIDPTEHEIDAPAQGSASATSIDEIDVDQIRQPISATPDADAAVHRLNESYALINSINEIFRIKHNDFVKPGKFHLQHSNEIVEDDVGGKLKRTSASAVWLRSPNRRCHEGVIFAPGKDRVVGNNVNLWRGWGVGPKAGDITPWNELLDFVFGDELEHRNWFEQWAAYPIQNPGVKLHAAVVLWSARQGVGKTLLGQTIGRLYGSDSNRVITSKELQSKFNGWAKCCQFVLCEENTSASRLTESDRLKHLITGETIPVEEKFQPLIEIQNCINFLFTSNHANAFYLESSDRRYFVWELQKQPLPDSFYSDFVDWRDRRGGAEALMEHFCNLDVSGFNPNAKAPMTAAKAAMIDASRTPLEQWLARFRDDPGYAIEILGREVITVEELADIFGLREKTRVSPDHVGKALQRLGRCEKRRIQIGKGNRLSLHAISRVEHWSALDNIAWTREAQKLLVPITDFEPTIV